MFKNVKDVLLSIKNDYVEKSEGITQIQNTTESIFKVQKKETKRKKAEYKKDEQHRNRLAQITKRKSGDMDMGKNKDIFDRDQRKKKGGFWGKLLLGVGLLGGALFLFRDQITEWFGDRLKEVGDSITATFKDMAKTIEDWGYDKFEGEVNAKLAQEIQDVEGATRDEKIATLEKTLGADNLSKKQREKIEQQIEFLESGEVKQDRVLGMGGRSGGDISEEYMEAGGFITGDVSRAIRLTPGRETEVIQILEQIKELSFERQKIVKEMEVLQADLDNTKDSETRTRIINKINTKAQKRITVSKKINKLYTSNPKVQSSLKTGRDQRVEQVALQSGGAVGNVNVTNMPRKDAELDERVFSTTGYTDGMTVLRKQDGGLVIFKGHGDVPSNSGIPPGTDGPGTSIEGKFKPTAEQHYVEKVGVAADNLARRKGVDLRYQPPLGRFLDEKNPKSNWSQIDQIRSKGDGAMELHFDAYGMQDGKMIEGDRGLLHNGHTPLNDVEKSVKNKFGTHPVNSSKRWGSLILELDSLKYASSRINTYAKMLVDSVDQQQKQKENDDKTNNKSNSDGSEFFEDNKDGSNAEEDVRERQEEKKSFTIADIFTGGIDGLKNLSGNMKIFMDSFMKSFKETLGDNPFGNNNPDDADVIDAAKKDSKLLKVINDVDVSLPDVVKKEDKVVAEAMAKLKEQKDKPTKLQSGGAVGEATKVLKKDEALSSLSKGKNDWVREGGNSVVSKTPWSSVKPSTQVHAYTDSVGQSTIGWGSTYYDSILSGTQPVKMGDTISKKRADDILTTNVSGLASTYSQKIPHWGNMSSTQQAGVLTLGYNAPYGPIGSYKNLTRSLKAGKPHEAAQHVQRGGPSPERLKEEARMLKSGPKDATIAPPSKAISKMKPETTKEKPTSPKQGGIFSGVKKFFGFQNGGQVSASKTSLKPKSNSLQTKVMKLQDEYNINMGNNTMRPTVVIRKPKSGGSGGHISTPAAAPMEADGGEINSTDLGSLVHRLNAGAIL